VVRDDHPFDDGNGRIARAVADWALALGEQLAALPQHVAQIRHERNDYCNILETTQKERWT
jgi:Fic family protein